MQDRLLRSAHSPAPPPPLHAYWFYSSSLPIDDPLAPLPIAASSSKEPPRPFSRYDSDALEAAYKELLQEHQDRLDARPKSSHSRSPSPSSPSSLTQTTTADSREVAREGHPVLRHDNYAREDVVEVRDELMETPATAPPDASPLEAQRRQSQQSLRAPFSPSSAPTASATCPHANTKSMAGRPFARSLSTSKHDTPSYTPPSRSSGTQQRSRKMSDLEEETHAEKEIPVGIQRLHKVLLPSFIMTPLYWSPLHDVSSVVRGTWFYKDTMMPVETEIANRLEMGWTEVQAWTEEWDIELASAVEVGIEGEEKVRWQLWDASSLSPPNTPPASRAGERETVKSFESELPRPLSRPSTGDLLSDSSKVKPNPYDWVLFANKTDAYICRDTMLSFGNKRPLANIRKGKSVGTHVVRGFCEKTWLRLHPSKKRPAPPQRQRSASVAPVGSNGNMRLKEKDKRSYSTAGSLRVPPSSSTQYQAGGNVGSFEQHQAEGLGVGEDEQDRGKVTDLFLVIHGIGQKLSERVESFHFTHAINSFRRLVNVELKDETVRPLLRDGGQVGMMVLPINWRHNLTFEDGLPSSGKNTSTDPGPPDLFSLSDITLPSIPAVRNLIGDVMLDIPYYLSHHKQKMVRAVIKEANRVYRLWCKNNPGFEREGRVHIIAHSLGTAIALDILSHQPTKVDGRVPPPPQSAGRDAKKCKELSIQEEHFEFDTKNIFFCGSPAGFFLLLNRSILLPRKGRRKPGTSGEDLEPGVAGEAGTYGCMAVDNVYNVLHYSDPIAYRLNPTVDTNYAATLKTAYVPSTASSILGSIASSLRSVIPSTPAPTAAVARNPVHPSMARLPSNIELETHDFSREEMAEKRLALLNDNGQIDWYLRVHGTFESQYLNMLGAHSSYWESRDFARMIVLEAGREIGSRGTLPGMRVQKKRAFMFK